MSEARPQGITRWMELVGLVALIASLVFVGLEVKQNTAVARAEAYRSLVSEINAIDLATLDPGVADVMGRVWYGEAMDDLSPAEQTQAVVYFFSLLRTYEGLYKQVMTGVLDAEALQLMSGRDWDHEFYRVIWGLQSQVFTPEFRAYFEAAHPFSN